MPYYKYVVPDRVDVLSNLKIRFTQPSALNDPFESFPAIQTSLNSREAKRYARQRIGQMAREGGLPQTPARSHIRDLRRDFLEWCDERHGDKAAEQLQIRARAMCDRLGLLLCMSKVPNNILMWSHYAKAHSGLVIEFDSNHEFFKYATQDVIYSSERPVWNVDDSRHPAGMEHIKSLDWAYEQEVRKTEMVGGKQLQLQNGKDFVAADPDWVPDPYSIHFFDLPSDLITGVIVGWKAAEESIRAIRDALSAGHFRRVKLRQAVPSRMEFKMEIVGLSRN
jgi:hypothetical protein